MFNRQETSMSKGTVIEKVPFDGKSMSSIKTEMEKQTDEISDQSSVMVRMVCKPETMNTERIDNKYFAVDSGVPSESDGQYQSAKKQSVQPDNQSIEEIKMSPALQKKLSVPESIKSSESFEI